MLGIDKETEVEDRRPGTPYALENCTNLQGRALALEEVAGKSQVPVCDGCSSLPMSRYYKIMDELRKESATLRAEVRVNSQTLER